MPILAPLLVVALLTATAYGIGAHDGATQETQLAASVTGVTSAGTPISAGGAPSSKSEAVSDQVANKQCDKQQPPYKRYDPEHKYGTVTVVKNGKRDTFFNLHGKPCSGPQIKGGICTRENFCDGSQAQCEQDIMKRTGKCEIKGEAKKIQLASTETKGLLSGSAQTRGQTPEQTPEIRGRAPGDTVTANAYKPDTPTQTTPTQTNRANVSGSNATQKLDEIARPIAPSQTTPLSTQAAQRGQVQVPGPAQTGQVAQISPTSPTAPGGAAFKPSGASGLPPGSTPPQNTFPTAPYTNPYAAKPSTDSSGSRNTGRTGASNLMRNFNASTIFSGITNFVSNVFTGTRSGQSAGQTIVQHIEQPSVAQPVMVQTPQQRPIGINQPVVPELPRAKTNSAILVPENTRLVFRVSRTATETASIETPQLAPPPPGTTEIQTHTLETLSAEAREQGLPSPFVFGEIASTTSVEDATQLLVKRISDLAPAPQQTTFAPASTTRRASSLVDLFHAISIPELLDAISQGSLDLIKRVAAKGTPGDAQIISGRVQGRIDLPQQTMQTSFGVRASNAAPSAQDASSPVPSAVKRAGTESTGYQERVEQNPTVVFSDTSVIHRTESTYIPLVRPTFVFGDVVPVPEHKEAASTAPTFLELVVKNGAKQIRSLIATVWGFILPPR